MWGNPPRVTSAAAPRAETDRGNATRSSVPPTSCVGPGQLTKQRPGEQHREEDLGQPSERRDGRAEPARADGAEHLCPSSGDDGQLADGCPPSGG